MTSTLMHTGAKLRNSEVLKTADGSSDGHTQEECAYLALSQSICATGAGWYSFREGDGKCTCGIDTVHELNSVSASFNTYKAVQGGDISGESSLCTTELAVDMGECTPTTM